MRTDFLDYPTAWAIQKEAGETLDHHPKCSSVPRKGSMSGPGFLCDCGALEREWERRKTEQPPAPTAGATGGD